MATHDRRPTTLGQMLERMREQHGWSQREMARRVDLSPEGYRNYAFGLRTPSRELIIRMAHELGIAPIELEIAALHDEGWPPAVMFEAALRSDRGLNNEQRDRIRNEVAVRRARVNARRSKPATNGG